MRIPAIHILVCLAVSSCATDVPPYVPGDLEELDASTVVEAPAPVAGNFHPADRDSIDRGAYLVELLGCGSCHTNGAFDGSPDMELALAGSNTGIAFSNPMGDEFPGVVYPPNITPDDATGIGKWSDHQIANAVIAGTGRHASRRIATMPWQGYARLDDDDVDTIVAYLRSIRPIENSVPREVQPGELASSPFIYFGVYRSGH